MINVGDVIIAKPKFLMKYKLPIEDRKFKVIELASYGGTIRSLISDFKLIGQIDFLEDFYFPSNINQEILALLDANIALKSFQAVTEDGKVIQIEGR